MTKITFLLSFLICFIGGESLAWCFYEPLYYSPDERNLLYQYDKTLDSKRTWFCKRKTVWIHSS